MGVGGTGTARMDGGEGTGRGMFAVAGGVESHLGHVQVARRVLQRLRYCRIQARQA